MTKDKLKTELKDLIISSCKLDMKPDEILDDSQLVQAGLELDSIEALQVLVALEEKYDIEVVDTDAQERHILANVNKLTDFIWEKVYENSPSS